METAELVTRLVQEVGAGWSRALILDALNRAQNEILGIDNEITRVKPDPFLATADATYSYVASSSLYDSSTGAQGSLIGDIRAVRRIYSKQSSLSLFQLQTLDPQLARFYRAETDRVVVYPDFIASKKPSNSDCVIKWPSGFNPGASTITWQGEAYIWPEQLLTENNLLTMPEEFCDTLLLFGARKRLEPREFGRNDDSLAIYAGEYRRFKNVYCVSGNQDGPLEAVPLIA